MQNTVTSEKTSNLEFSCRTDKCSSQNRGWTGGAPTWQQPPPPASGGLEVGEEQAPGLGTKKVPGKNVDGTGVGEGWSDEND